MADAIKPAWTDVALPPASALVSKSDARNWLGLYGDTSLDDEIQTALDAAIEKVAAHVGFRISDTQITDYFATLGPGARLQLSEPGVD